MPLLARHAVNGLKSFLGMNHGHAEISRRTQRTSRASLVVKTTFCPHIQYNNG